MNQAEESGVAQTPVSSNWTHASRGPDLGSVIPLKAARTPIDILVGPAVIAPHPKSPHSEHTKKERLSFGRSAFSFKSRRPTAFAVSSAEYSAHSIDTMSWRSPSASQRDWPSTTKSRKCRSDLEVPFAFCVPSRMRGVSSRRESILITVR